MSMARNAALFLNPDGVREGDRLWLVTCNTIEQNRNVQRQVAIVAGGARAALEILMPFLKGKEISALIFTRVSPPIVRYELYGFYKDNVITLPQYDNLMRVLHAEEGGACTDAGGLGPAEG